MWPGAISPRDLASVHSMSTWMGCHAAPFRTDFIGVGNTSFLNTPGTHAGSAAKFLLSEQRTPEAIGGGVDAANVQCIAKFFVALFCFIFHEIAKGFGARTEICDGHGVTVGCDEHNLDKSKASVAEASLSPPMRMDEVEPPLSCNIDMHAGSPRSSGWSRGGECQADSMPAENMWAIDGDSLDIDAMLSVYGLDSSPLGFDIDHPLGFDADQSLGSLDAEDFFNARRSGPASNRANEDFRYTPGNCLFDAISFQLDRLPGLPRYSATRLRGMVAEEVADHSQLYGRFLTGDVDGEDLSEIARRAAAYLSIDRNWMEDAADLAPAALATALERNGLDIRLVVRGPDGAVMQSFGYGQTDIELLYNGSDHYTPYPA